MRFRQGRSNDDLPEINLVPMMDVLMTVLTFFIIVSMTLTGQQIAGVNLPQTDGAGTNTDAQTQASLVIGLNLQNEIILEGRSIDLKQLETAMQNFYAQQPQGMVLLKADRSLDYKQVVQLLKTMRNIGGDRVSLAIDRQPELAQ